jgi:ABC-type lipoprotein release transport system permease subunit
MGIHRPALQRGTRGPVRLAGVTALMFVIVVAAIIVPARQAIKIPPAAALRVE